MKFFIVYGLIAGIAYGQTLTDILKFFIWEIIGFSIGIIINIRILMFMELLVQEKEKKTTDGDKK